MTVLNWIFRFVFDLLGWKIEIDQSIYSHEQLIFAVCPHNKWQDFPLGLATRAKMKIDVRYLGKAELFSGPFGFLFKYLGGTPVIRTKNNNVVDNVVATFKANPKLKIALAPEGTRKNVSKLRTGFYWIANGANIPISMVAFDFGNKKVIVTKPFITSGDFENDMKVNFVPFFENIYGQNDWIENYKKGKF